MRGGPPADWKIELNPDVGGGGGELAVGVGLALADISGCYGVPEVVARRRPMVVTCGRGSETGSQFGLSGEKLVACSATACTCLAADVRVDADVPKTCPGDVSWPMRAPRKISIVREEMTSLEKHTSDQASSHSGVLGGRRLEALRL